MPPVTAAMVAGGRTLGEPRLDGEGARVAFVSTEDGRSRLVIIPVEGGPELVVSSEPAPSPARPLSGGVFDWTPDGDALVYAARGGGLWRQPASGGAPVQLTDDRCGGPAVSTDGERVAFDVEQQHIDVVRLDGSGRVRLTGAVDFALDPAWSPDGAIVAWHEWDVPAMPWNSSRIVVAPADGTAPPRTMAGGDGVAVAQPRFSPDGRALAYLSDAGGWLNVTVADLAGGDVVSMPDDLEHGPPTWGGGIRSFAWSPDGAELVVCRNERGFGSLVRWRPGHEPEPLAKAVHGGLSWRGNRIAAVRTGARTPTQIVVYEGTRRRTLAVGPIAFGDGACLPEPELVEWTSDDGSTIPGRLYRPPGVDRPPLICWVHGGPTDQWQVEWRPRFTFWLDRGWAILVPDHRGSTGHGRAFTQALARQWGDLDVIDVVAGLRAAADRGWGDADRFVMMGASAGGFTVLNVLASHPGLCAAGVDVYGVTDLIALDESEYRFEAHYLHSLIGPRPENESAYRERSPLHRVDGITDPLLVFQGRDDPVVSPEQTESLVARLEQLGRAVEVHFYDGEGHGWSRAATVMDELERTEAFLERYVKRSQR